MKAIVSTGIMTLLLATAWNSANAWTKTIRMSTEHTDLVYEVAADGRLMTKYYGPRLAKLPDVWPMEVEAFPAGGGQWYGEPAISMTHSDGSMVTELIYDRFEERVSSDGIPEKVICLKDKLMPFRVELHTAVYSDEDVLVQWVEAENGEDGQVIVYNCGSSFLPFPSGAYYLMRISGSGLAEASQLQEYRLPRGMSSIECRRGIRTTRFENPSFILGSGSPTREDAGDCVGGALAWSGNFRISFELDAQDCLAILAGESPYLSSRALAPGERYVSPKMLWTRSSSGRGQLSRNFHDWGRRYGLTKGYEENPVVLNSWEGTYYDFDEKKLIGMIDAAADIGVEMFVLDDGWFGEKYPRNSDTQGLGDWIVNKKKLPRGLQYLARHAASKGMGFGLWVEPEMVSPRSVLAERHPEWVVRSPGRSAPESRHQWMLDLCNPEVQDFVFSMVDGLLKDNPGISYIKWDANRAVSNPGSLYLPQDCQTRFWHDYVEGLYSVYARLRDAWPDVIFQDCASGGGRVEYGALRWHNEFWGSDNTDPLKRIYIQWGEGMIYPPKAIGSHVSASPNRQTGRVFPLKFRFDVAMSGRLGMELPPSSLDSAETKFAKEAIRNYKKHVRPVVTGGDLYRLASPFAPDSYHAAEMFVSKDKGKAVLFVWCLDFKRQEVTPLLRLAGLDGGASYRVTELNVDESCFDGDGEVFSGAVLENAGMRVNISKPYQSAVFVLTKE